MTKEPKRGLFIGRFQPYHNGHQKAIEEIVSSPDLDEIIIGIGSAQESHTPYNPFTLDERKLMISLSLENMLDKPYHLIPIQDINDYDGWVDHVESLCPSFDVVYGNNIIIKTLFERAGYQVNSSNQIEISGTRVRNLMIQEGDWESLVPSKTAKVILDIGGVQRVKEISNKASNTADVIIPYKEGIVLIKRKNPPYKGMWALPGGYLDVGKESLEEAAVREIKEETNLLIKKEDLHLLGVYSDPQRDPRGPTITIAYYVGAATGTLEAKDDASEVSVFRVLPKKLAFDHKKILEDYQKKKEGAK